MCDYKSVGECEMAQPRYFISWAQFFSYSFSSSLLHLIERVCEFQLSLYSSQFYEIDSSFFLKKRRKKSLSICQSIQIDSRRW